MMITNNWRTPQRLNRILIVIGIGLLVTLVTVSLIVWAQLGSSAASLSQSQILQKARQHIQGNWTGDATDTIATQTTLGQVSSVSCTFMGHLVSSLTYGLGLDSSNVCDPDTIVWLVELRGTFNWQGTTTSFLQVVLDTHGNFIQANSGPLQP